MYISFRTRQLEKCYLSQQAGIREWGPEVACRFVQRVNVLHAIREVNDLRAFPQLNFHELKGNRKGQYAINLTGFWRLIFTLAGDNPVIIKVQEVSKHYGD